MKKRDPEMDHLRARLAEAEETLRVIRSGEVDALVVEGPSGSRVFTLMGADAGYRTMVEQMQEGAVTLDRSGSILYCNRRFADMLKMPHGDVIGNNLARFLPDLAPMAALLDAARRGSRRETQLRCADGGSIPVQLTASPLIGECDYTFYVMVVADLTVLRQKEQILEAERMTRSILETTAEGIVVCDAGGRVIQANQAARDLQHSDPVGLPFLEAFPLVMEGRDRVLNSIREGAGVRGVAASLEARSGEISLLVSAGPLHGPGDRRVGCVVSLVDVTRHANAEAELRTLNDNLEQRVIERTATVQQQGKRLRALASDLARAEERERERLGRMLHDHLQQLLVAANLKLGRLRRRRGSETAMEKIDEVESLLQQAIQASRDLTLELSPAILNDAGLVSAMKWLGRQMRDRYGLDVDIDVPEEVPESLEGLRFFVFSAARELLFNIVKHAGVMRAKLTLDPRHGGGLVRLAVEDQGSGFDDSVPARSGESGHGMPDIRHKLEMMGGEMRVDSARGRGTRVTLLIPVTVSAMEAFPLKPMPALAPSEEMMAPLPDAVVTRRPRRLRILLADDHTILRQGLAGLLSNEPDMEPVAEASTGLEALELARLLRPDVIVMDASMPEMSGLEATRHIAERFPDIVVVGLSMYDSEDMSDAMRAAGARAYVSKEKASEELCSVIRNVTRAKRRKKVPPPPTAVTPSRA